jgi:8-oxo-dGTP diphosphatase
MGKDQQGIATGPERYQVIPRTLVFATCDDRLLLLKGGPHKRLWAGKYNGLGGHVERGEDIRTAALRELAEEAGLYPVELHFRGLVHIDAGDAQRGIVLFVFHAVADSLQTVASPEGTLEWHPLDSLPFGDMVEDLPVLLPRVLKPGEEPCFAAYSYDNSDRLVIRMADPFPNLPQE